MTHFSDADGARGIAHQVRGLRRRSRATCPASARWPTARPACAIGTEPACGPTGCAPASPCTAARRTSRTHDIAHWDLQPTMTLSRAAHRRAAAAPGDTVGYGSSFTADAPMRIGVVACGYADGYPRHCSTGTPVLVDGVRTRMVGPGQHGHDHGRPDAGARRPASAARSRCGAAPPNGAVLPIDEVARAGGTVGYELMCALAPRVPARTGVNGEACRAAHRRVREWSACIRPIRAATAPAAMSSGEQKACAGALGAARGAFGTIARRASLVRVARTRHGLLALNDARHHRRRRRRASRRRRTPQQGASAMNRARHAPAERLTTAMAPTAVSASCPTPRDGTTKPATKAARPAAQWTKNGAARGQREVVRAQARATSGAPAAENRAHGQGQDTVYTCSECGGTSPKWLGQVPAAAAPGTH